MIGCSEANPRQKGISPRSDLVRTNKMMRARAPGIKSDRDLTINTSTQRKSVLTHVKLKHAVKSYPLHNVLQ